jgi:ABC-type multidrug transport system fused ATPase/permease subunit
VGIWRSVRASLDLLGSRDRKILLLLVGLQFALALMDFVGVILVGLVAAISASAISGELPGQVSTLLRSVGLDSVDAITLAVVLAVIAGFLFIAKSVLSYLVMRRSYRFLANRQAMVSSKLASLLLSRSILDVQKRSSQETAYALTQGANAATIGVLGGGVAVASEIAVIVVVLFAMFAVDVFVALFSVVFFFLIALILHRLLANWASRLGLEQSTAEIASIASVQESLRTYREVVVTGRRGFYIDRFQELRWRAARVQADLQIMGQVSKYVFEIALVIGAAILALTQFWTKDVVAAVAVIAVFLAATSRITPSLMRLQSAVLSIRSSSGVATPTIALAQELLTQSESSNLDREVVERIRRNLNATHDDFEASVSMESVSLRYPNADRAAVLDATVHVPAGTSIAFVGPTGAGKSTLVDLVLGVLTPDAGSVQIGGLRPAEATSRWPGALAYVPQDIAVIDGTVRSNVAAGLPNELVDDERVWEALDRAQLGNFLRGERDGLDTVVGEHGVRLSGGQRQRLGLARALYTRPKLLVLDEATSALDAETELAVAQALESLEGDVTLIIVAHRLATIRHSDHVAYLQEGRVLAQGTFEEVREQVPNFDRQAELLGL